MYHLFKLFLEYIFDVINLIYLSIGVCDKSVKYYYLQFISNLIRNNKNDLTDLLDENVSLSFN